MVLLPQVIVSLLAAFLVPSHGEFVTGVLPNFR